MRLSKLRIMYDKNLIFFIVKIIETIKRYLGRISFDLIMKESKRKKIFSVKGGKYKNTFAKSFLIKKSIYKVVEPQYKFTPIKPELKKSFTNKNISLLGLNLDKKNELDKEKSKTKRSEKSLLSNKENVKEDVKEDIKENNEEKEKE